MTDDTRDDELGQLANDFNAELAQSLDRCLYLGSLVARADEPPQLREIAGHVAQARQLLARLNRILDRVEVNQR